MSSTQLTLNSSVLKFQNIPTGITTTSVLSANQHLWSSLSLTSHVQSTKEAYWTDLQRGRDSGHFLQLGSTSLRSHLGFSVWLWCSPSCLTCFLIALRESFLNTIAPVTFWKFVRWCYCCAQSPLLPHFYWKCFNAHLTHYDHALPPSSLTRFPSFPPLYPHRAPCHSGTLLD